MTEYSEQQTQRPAARFTGSGNIQVAVWKHHSEEGADRYSIKIERSYKDGEEYKSTQYLRAGDLLRVQQLMSKADDWIEQDKGRQTGVSEALNR